MNIELTKDKYNESIKAYELNTEQSIESELNLPDYLSDIRKILKCCVTPNIFNVSVSGDRVTLDGEATVRAVYSGDNGKIQSYEQTVPFSKYAEFRDEGCEYTVTARAKTDYVNCRAVSGRRISVTGSIGIHFCLRKIAVTEPVVSCEGFGAQLHKRSLKAHSLIGECNKMFEMGETVSLPEGQSPIVSLIRADANAVIDSVKTVKDKMLIKGDMTVSVLYCGDSESGMPEKLTHTMPISQIVEIPGLAEDCICDVKIEASAVTVIPKKDSNGENRLADITVRAVAEVSSYEEKEYTLSDDCYSTEYELSCEYKNTELLQRLMTYRETKQVRSSFEKETLGIEKIIDAFPVKCTANAVCESESFHVKGECTVGILYSDKNGEYGYTEKNTDFLFERDGTASNGSLIAEPTVNITGISVVLSGEKAEINITVNVYMPVFEIIRQRLCIDIVPDENREKKKDCSKITVYFADTDENIWDIAKKYNTTVQKIKDENGVEDDEIHKSCVLMIPS